jgi:imidazole glycerol-phosphate synthase subunit HisH
MPEVTIIDYGSANIRSVQNAFEYLGASVKIVDDGSLLDQAECIVLPGVGIFDAGMKGLHARGFAQALPKAVLDKKVPYLGICLGMQFLMETSAEGDEAGLGWFKGRCERFDSGFDKPPVPQIAWNDTAIRKNSAMFKGIDLASDFYFVHSYYIPKSADIAPAVAATCNYGTDFVAAFEQENIWACQFHPEKSQQAGLMLLQNFLSIGLSG